MGKCCKCEEHRWEDPQEVVWEDRKTGDKYCIFHAPEDCKFLRFADEEPCTNNEFNDLVFERILNAKEKGIECELSYAILPFDISFDGPLNLPGINFYNAKFYGVVDMLAIDFSGEVNFNCAQFKSKVYLQDIDFRKGACINGVTFLDDVLISSSYFYDLVVINDTMLGSSSSIIIQGIDKLSLKEFNFDRNTLSRLRFMNCSWPDTLCFGDWEIESAAGLLFAEDLYRAMKQRAAVEHDQPLVSRWHFREKLMQLKQLLNNKRSNDLLEVVEDNEAKWWPRAWAWCKLAVLPRTGQSEVCSASTGHSLALASETFAPGCGWGFSFYCPFS